MILRTFKLPTHHPLVPQMVGEIRGQHVCVRHQHLDHRLGKPLHVSVPDLRVLTLQLLKNLEALCQLGEHVHYRTREIGVLCVLPELQERGD